MYLDFRDTGHHCLMLGMDGIVHTKNDDYNQRGFKRPPETRGILKTRSSHTAVVYLSVKSLRLVETSPPRTFLIIHAKPFPANSYN